MTNMYEFEGRLIRAQKDGNEIWFRGRDVAEAFGYKRPGEAIHDHVEEDDRKKVMQETRSRNGTLVKSSIYLVNEPGVYSLVFSSKLPSAKRFKNWVFKDVLPSIRKLDSTLHLGLLGTSCH